MKHFKISIPEKRDFERWFKILKFKVTGGFSCTDCGAKTKFDHVHFEADINGKRFMLENHNAGQCPECTKDELNEYAVKVYNIKTVECNWCKEVKPTTTWLRDPDIKSRICFGEHWWNGHHICQDCMNEGFVRRGETFSSITNRINGQTYYINELGIKIKIEV